MSGRVPQNFLNDLLERTDLVALISARVPLRKNGHHYKACCPFHNEKTPSFNVHPTKQFYHCFGCGQHGNAIGFLMEYDKLPFLDAVETLAKQAGVNMPEHFSASPKQESHKQFYQLLEQASHYYQTQLRTHPAAPAVIDYLKKRGLTGQIAKEYGLGFAPEGWDNLLKHLSYKHEAALTTIGMTITKEQGRGCYDRFRNRLMFPIRDSRGRVLGFGGRVLDDSTPKYLNSPETPIYHKGSQLYGLYEVLQRKQKLEYLLLVEGYMDVIALAQHEVYSAVASLGTAATRQQLERAFRQVNTLVFCFDGDQAGTTAAARALETVLPLLEDGRTVNFMFLPQGEDPDTLIRKEGTAAFKTRIANAEPLSDFFFARLQQEAPATSPDSRARLGTLAMPLIETLPEGLFKQMLLDQLAKMIGMDVSRLAPRPKTQSPTRLSTTSSQQPLQVEARSPLRHAISLLLNQPSLISNVTDITALSRLRANGTPVLLELISLLRAQPNLKTGSILEHWRDRPEYETLAQIAAQEFILPEAGLVAEFQDTLLRVTQQAYEQQMEVLHAKASREGLTDSEKRELQDLIKRGRI